MSEPFRELPHGTITREAALELVNAAHGARFALHTALSQARDEDDVEALEVYGETMAELTEALEKIYGEQPLPKICSGCSPLSWERHGFREVAA